MKIMGPDKTQVQNTPLLRKEEDVNFFGRLVKVVKKSILRYTLFVFSSIAPDKALSDRAITLIRPPTLNKPWIFKATRRQAEEVIASMSMRANKDGQDILESILNSSATDIFISCNGKEGEDARFAIMCTNDNPPTHKYTHATEQSSTLSSISDMDKLIDSCLWVEALVSDPKTGQGSLLLDLAETMAIEKDKNGLALSAFEFDPKDDDKNSSQAPYSIADYYANKKGFIYTGQAHEELEQQDEGEIMHYFYPIYVRSIDLTKKMEDVD